ncbi:cytochrome P450 [Sphaerisporangium sp. TRM90804]|uniref:cytochrome P450 n=1 Tax=Sphaerisporangium sp. TRM90804 TaxID=3031113 RepID=UPI0024483477|nr:cytochrome P450 [Sphaerisporangium sp. TRM90804]MDH2424507.1 cytochrome P450 [Sphaerisporangium sp. TRM90804]
MSAGLRSSEELLSLVYSPGEQENLYRHYASLLEAAPVHFTPEGGCVVVSHSGCEQVLRGRAFSALGPEILNEVRPDWRVHPAYVTGYGGMFGMNPPEHTRLRKLAMDAFTPRRVELMEDTIQELVDELVGDMARRAAGGQPVDFMACLADPLPVLVIGDLLGVPRTEHERLRRTMREWLRVFEPTVTEEEVALADAAAVGLWGYLGDLIADRRAHPGDDLLSELIRGSADGDRLSPGDLIGMVASLYVAGFDTTTNLLANGMKALCDHPDRARELRSTPGLARSAVEELLRFDAPFPFTTRVATEDVEVDGYRVPARTHVTLFLAAANHDPEVFPDPGRLDLHRRPNPHLTLGHGVHFCLGAHLARLEAKVAFPTLLRRFADLSLAAPPTRRASLAIHGYSVMPVHAVE